jgi:hypothetical protein
VVADIAVASQGVEDVAVLATEDHLSVEAGVLIEAETEATDKCLTPFVIIAERVAKCLLGQLKENQFTAVIVLKRWVAGIEINPQIDLDLRIDLAHLKLKAGQIWEQLMPNLTRF